MEQNSINFLRDSLIHHRDIKNALDQKASFLVAVSGVIFGLSVGRLQEAQFLVLAISSFFTVLLSVLIIRLPFRGITKEEFGLMCWWFSDKSLDQYKDELNEIFTSDEKISQEYIKEIWNLANYSLKPKGKLLKWASSILVLGLLGGFILFFI
jgi:hypothetical protein